VGGLQEAPIERDCEPGDAPPRGFEFVVGVPATAVERVGELAVALHQEVTWQTDSDDGHVEPAADLHRTDAQRDGDAQPGRKHPMKVRVLGVAIVRSVAAQATGHEQGGKNGVERRGTFVGQTVKADDDVTDVRTWVEGCADQPRQQVEVVLGSWPIDQFSEAVGRIHAVKVPSATFAAMFPGAFLDTHPDKPAVIMGTSGFIQTFAELDAAANRLSHLLRAAGVQPGDHVAICMENHDRYLEVVWGCHYAGVVYTCTSSRLTSGELSYILNDCAAKVFITSHYKSDQATEILASTPNVGLRLMLDGTVDGYDSYEAAVAAHPPTPLPGDRIAGSDMLYSSGTTGQPKGVARAFNPLPLETTANGVSPLLTLLFGVTNESVYLSPAPFYHAAPLRFCMAAQQVGCTVIAMDHFDPEQYLALVERYQATVSQVVPTMFVRMLKLAPEVRTKYDVSSLKCVIHAAAPCPVPVKQQMIEWFGPIIHEYYAGTEGNGFVYCNSDQWLAHPGTVGTPIGCVLHICGDEGEDLPAGESGTVYFEGGAQFEYHNDEEKTKSSRHPEHSWSTLGDVGYLTEDNFLFLTDRKAYMIISGGVNIYPQESENVLVTHPKVADVAVFGVPNDDFGEEVKAVVQPITMPASDEEAAALSKELIAFCRSQLADVKCPRSIDFRDELPRHPTGKLYKRLLKDDYWKAAGRSI